MQFPLVSVIILTNKKSDDTLECLTSLFKSDYHNLQVILLDNLSDKAPLKDILDKYPQIQAITLTENLGYAGNNNIGVRIAVEQGADWVFILNDDTILDPSCISEMISSIEDNDKIGMMGPMVYHYNEPDVIQSAGGVFDKNWTNFHLGQNEIDHGQFHSVHKVEWVSGCAMMVKNSLIQQVGLLDERYFLYWEETEWCIRARSAGWEIIQVPFAKLWHKGVSRDYQPKPYVTYYMTRNQLFTFAKHKAPLSVWLNNLTRIFMTLISWTIKPRWRFKREHRDAMWMGLVHFFQGRYGNIST